ncbi:MAG: hypothetical protein D8M52_03065 [Chlorobi bacterium]|nr:hypothetical protein [Chlorobiota bacterium]
MFFTILNVAIRSAVLLLGFGILFTGLGAGISSPIREVFGALCILFGIYRLLMFYQAKKKYHQ